MKHGDLVDLLELNIAGKVLAVVLHMAGILWKAYKMRSAPGGM
jgi:hypothetical protein